MNMLQKNIIINGLNICFYQSDKLDRENSLVFLHGWGADALSFKPVLEKCGSFLAVDLPGFGKSEAPKGAWAISGYADFLDRFLNKLEMKNPVLAGHSFGGSIIIKYASRYHNLKRIILISSAGIRKNSLRKMVLKVIAKIFKLPFLLPGLRGLKNKAKKKFYYYINATDYIVSGKMQKTFLEVINKDLSEEMKKIKAPTIIIWGDEDLETPLADAKIMKKLISGSKLFVINSAGHFPFIDQPEQFNKLFFNILKSND